MGGGTGDLESCFKGGCGEGAGFYLRGVSERSLTVVLSGERYSCLEHFNRGVNEVKNHLAERHPAYEINPSYVEAYPLDGEGNPVADEKMINPRYHGDGLFVAMRQKPTIFEWAARHW